MRGGELGLNTENAEITERTEKPCLHATREARATAAANAPVRKNARPLQKRPAALVSNVTA
jgi:hypothetical protein